MKDHSNHDEGAPITLDPGDVASIYHRYSAYCFAVDDRSVSGVADCFTVDAPLRVNGQLKATGRSAIADMQRTPSDRRHLAFNHLIESISAFQAHVQAYFLVLSHDGLVVGHGRYADIMLKQPDGRWRFSERDIDFQWRDPTYLDVTSGLGQGTASHGA